MMNHISTIFQKSTLHLRKPWLSGLVVLMLVLFTFSTAAALDQVMDPGGQVVRGVEPISTLIEDQILPRVEYGYTFDEYLVVWDDVIRDDDHDIYAIRVNSLGTPVYGEIPVAVSNRMDIRPDVAFSTNMNEYLVVWENEWSPTDHDIYAQRVSADGSLVGGEIHVAYTTAYDRKPSVVYNPWTYQYLVVFERNLGSDEFTQLDIMAQLLTEDGLLFGGEITIANGYMDEQLPAVACDGLNFLVVWQGDYSEETNIYGQRVLYDGSLIGSQFGISTWGNTQLVPRLAYNSDDAQYFVVWEDHYFSPWEINGQRLDQYGNLIGSPVGVAVGGENNHTDPDVAYMDNTRSYLVVWQFEYSTSDHDIYSRRVAFDGSQPEAEVAISTLGSEEKHPSLASNSLEQGLAVWEDWRNYGSSGVDIYGSLETVFVPVLSGVVYQGEPGDYSMPLPGVYIELGCSNGQGDFGTLISWTWTDAYGQYFLPVYNLCEYYNIVETDPDGFFSTGSQTTGGVKLSSNWIYYNYPLTGKVLSGNYFWDKPEGPGDITPPGNWTNFEPTDWVNVQTVPVTAQVEDTQSGLDVSTAIFQYSIDNGDVWSGWMPASITGQDGTTDPQTISANVPFGQDSGPASLNRVMFQVQDMAGNTGTSPEHVVYIDTVPPTNPTGISSPTHTPYVWSNNQNITVQWSGATDERSGINGYSISYDHNPYTIPDIYRDTIDPSQVIYAYEDSNTWYFHVRTLDNAGNAASGAVHYGPFYIDITVPTAWMVTQTGGVNQLNLEIRWDGGDNLSGLNSFDVQRNINGGGWTDWKVDFMDFYSNYTGERGQEVSFRARAIDTAGNVGAWSSPITITFGVSVVVRVENENGSPLNGAEVYWNGNLVGETYGNGTWTLYNVLLGDQLTGRYKVAEQNSIKHAHDCCGGDWTYRTYITSLNFDNAGNPQLQIINDTNITQVVRVQKSNTLISIYLLVSVEWDADSTYMSELRTGLQSASQYLYDLTDGQMMFGIIDVNDNAEHWLQADIRIHASNQVWPNAKGSIGGIWHDIDEHIFMGRYFDGQWSNSGSWTQADGFRTFIHEFGHYGMSLYDEYLNRSGGKDGQGCTIDRKTTPVDVQASFMDFQYTATEMCSALPLHPHNTNTLQDDENGGPCWDTVYDRYKDSQNPARWVIERPNDRGSIMPGPNTIPIPGWSYILWHDNNTGACAPFETSWYYPDNNQPAIDFDTWVISNSMYQGKTVANANKTAGVITILGAYNGSTIRVEKSCGWFCTDSGSTTASCPKGLNDLEQTSNQPLAPLALQRDPFGIEITSQPVGDNTVLQITLLGSISFPDTPLVNVLQDGSSVPIAVSLTFDGVKYIGTVNLDPTRDLSGIIMGQATNSEGYTVYRMVPFEILVVNSAELTWITSSDGSLELYLPEGSLPNDTGISVQPYFQVDMEQNTNFVVGNPYRITTSNGIESLQQPAMLNIYYSKGLETLRPYGLFKWDEAGGQWILISTNIDFENQFISAQINELGIYALLGMPVTNVYFPIVQR